MKTKMIPAVSTHRDPVCGMTVDAASAAGRSEFEGRAYYFCSTHCQRTFDANPAAFVRNAAVAAERERTCCGKAAAPREPSSCHHEAGQGVTPSRAAKYFCPMCPGVESDQPGDCPKCGMALERNPAWRPAAKTIYTCPMHPDVEQDHPGECPKCGMALEPKTAAPEPEDDAELRDMTRRLWIGGALTLPVFLLAMAHMIPGAHAGAVSRWVQFALATPVVLWAGWPFFVRGWRSLLARHLNMFTLIAMGVGTAYLYSVVAMLAPGLFPQTLQQGGVGIYFEAAAVI
ncbi:MAG TPA: heavy metal-binding domain-containing protein, partial [Chthoniobacteraceae bacterium]|nr:heavy metal-binding domain-containing protein [Chthoniobacteraceae bacterium]